MLFRVERGHQVSSEEERDNAPGHLLGIKSDESEEKESVCHDGLHSS